VNWKSIAVVAVLAASIGGTVSALVTHALNNAEDHSIQRGQVLHVGGPDLLPGFPGTPWCNDYNHFCISQSAPGQYVALYNFTTQESFREQGCTVRWDSSRQFDDPSTGQSHTGWFVDPCGGAIFDISGHKVFGPAPRDLDRFPIGLADNEFTVDTRTLICGDGPDTTPLPCTRAPIP
jgi:hypothetical protein